MNQAIDHTHDPAASSWVDGANSPNAEFPIQNLPLGVFEYGQSTQRRIGVAIGDHVLDIAAALDSNVLPELAEFAIELRMTDLNALMRHGRRASGALRHAVFGLLRADSQHQEAAATCLRPMREVRMRLPVQIGDFTDFFTSIHHARRAGELMRPDMPVAPNFRNMPIAYHGRASSVVESGVPCIRPRGQTAPADAAVTAQGYVPTQSLDFELEVGCLIGRGNALGSTISIDEAEDHMFGLCLVNDWSARDIQFWESYPLGPFLAKSFMTTVSPWLVTLEALAPFRVAAPARGPEDPPLSSALTSPRHAAEGGISISLEVHLQTAAMRKNGLEPVVLTRPQFSEQYWTLAQMITHHASNGCNLRTADLLSSGTVSGVERENSGCMLELTDVGKTPLRLPSGETRRFLEDGDIVWLRGVCGRDGYKSIGFGASTAQIEGAR